eukprot:5656719-Karenia_brevis.AAC.1
MCIRDSGNAESRKAKKGWLTRIVQNLYDSTLLDTKAFTMSLIMFEHIFSWAITTSGFVSYKLVPHGMRHGGASYDAAHQ